MKNKKKYIKEDRGITLIALVITIIVIINISRNKYSNVNRK